MNAGRGNSQYNAEVTYKYQPTPREYLGERIFFTFSTHAYQTEGGARECIAPYKKGAKVTVYYDPSDPGNAVLHPGVRCSLFLSVFLSTFGVFMLGVAGLFAWLKFFHHP